jgi:hypothetical protein
MLRESVRRGTVPVADVVVGLVAALRADEMLPKHGAQGLSFVGSERGIVMREVDADLGPPAGLGQHLRQSRDIGRRDDVLHPVRQGTRWLLPGGHPQCVAVELVAGDADIARPERLQQRDEVAVVRVEVPTHSPVRHQDASSRIS